MRKLSLLITFLLFACHSSDKKIERQQIGIVYKSDIYEVIKSFTKCNSNSSIYLTEEDYSYFREGPMNLMETIKVKADSIYTNEDFKFIEKQIASSKIFRLNADLLNCKQVISTDTLDKLHSQSENIDDFWRNLRQKFGKDISLESIGLPLFSKNKEYVIFSSTTYWGPHSMGSNTTIYKKINNKWERVRSLAGWVT
ncbi:hypothetical protein HYN48_13810 [Flavobacterium magnum]|uniref:Uncharacterized protein n=1 Tax=Flavobacterium magnum TaxID=2162713 RepID=A0A2S0RHI2_9FLAO|nr:hypothetical protein [Flavobacterium magnum]AWA31075.1 hypothetical protein HYN48_13810 [Flavobacterium magnum]